MEDYRENSGHLQAMSPAPVSGIVELSVQLNDHISKGQRMAVIEDEFGKQLAEVKAEHDGVVFMLRAIPFVKKGDTLGGILPTTQSKTTIR